MGYFEHSKTEAVNFQMSTVSLIIYTVCTRVPKGIHMGDLTPCCSLLCILHAQIMGQISSTPLLDRWEPKGGGVFQKQVGGPVLIHDLQPGAHCRADD